MILSQEEYKNSFVEVDGVIYTPKTELLVDRDDNMKITCFRYRVIEDAQSVYIEATKQQNEETIEEGL